MSTLLIVREIKGVNTAAKKVLLNEEWFIVENVGDKPLSTQGCSVGVGRGSGRLRVLGTLDPGFTIAPGEQVRVITGNPGKKSHGVPPESTAIRNYHLFQGEPLLAGAGSTVALLLRQLEIARATFDPAAPGGVAVAAS